MILIFPPLAKACEPPAGIARLYAALRSANISCRLLDANLEGQLWLLNSAPAMDDTWSRRALKNLPANLKQIRQAVQYRSPERYSRTVMDINRVLAISGKSHDTHLTLADYQHDRLSPVRSADLLHAAQHPEQDPFYPWFARRLDELMLAEPAKIIGFSLNFLSQALCAFAMIGFLRRRYPTVKIVLGGGLVTSWLSGSGWTSPFTGLVDQLIAGPGELPLLALAGAAQPAETPLPDYSTLPLADYLAPGFILPYSAAGGCYWNRCSFCPEQAEGNRYLPLPADRVVTELHRLTQMTSPALIHILDNAISPALLSRLATNPPGAPWYGFVRFIPELLDPGFCLALKNAGCVMLKLGLESGDQQVLDRLSKGIDLSAAATILHNLKEAGIGTYIYLLFGTPAETETEARKTLAFVQRHGKAIDFLNLAQFNMPVQSVEALELSSGEFYAGDLSLYTGFRHPHGWERRQVRQFVEKVFKKDPAVARILRGAPPFYGSNHAPFFTPGMQPGCGQAL